jgi:hypothetical protein
MVCLLPALGQPPRPFLFGNSILAVMIKGILYCKCLISYVFVLAALDWGIKSFVLGLGRGGSAIESVLC